VNSNDASLSVATEAFQPWVARVVTNFGVRPTFFEGIPDVSLEIHSFDPVILHSRSMGIEVQFWSHIRGANSPRHKSCQRSDGAFVLVFIVISFYRYRWTGSVKNA
jgi:hypothetical protein